MTALYEIASHYKTAFAHLSETLEDVDMDDASKHQIILDSLVDIQGSFEDKALNVAAYVNNLKLELLGVKTVEERITKRVKALNNQIQWLNDYLLSQLQVMNLKQVKNAEIVVSIRNNPAKVIITDEQVVPSAYKSIINTIKVDKTAIATDLKDGKTVNGCYLQASQRLHFA
jgi:hypothetical protein